MNARLYCPSPGELQTPTTIVPFSPDSRPHSRTPRGLHTKLSSSALRSSSTDTHQPGSREDKKKRQKMCFGLFTKWSCRHTRGGGRWCTAPTTCIAHVSRPPGTPRNTSTGAPRARRLRRTLSSDIQATAPPPVRNERDVGWSWTDGAGRMDKEGMDICQTKQERGRSRSRPK